MRGLRALFGLVLCLSAARAFAPPAGPVLRLSVIDPANHPLPGVQVQLKVADQLRATLVTDAQGQVLFDELRPGLYTLLASKDGYHPVRQTDSKWNKTAPYRSN